MTCNGDVLTFSISNARVNKSDDSASAGVAVQLYQSPAMDVEQVGCAASCCGPGKNRLTLDLS